LSLAVAGAFAMGLHVGLIVFASHVFAGSSRGSFGARTVMITAASMVAPSAARPAPAAEPAPQKTEPLAAAHEAEAGRAAPVPAAPPVMEVQRAPAAAVRDSFTDYVDASLLSTRPRAEGEIAIPEPEVGTYRGAFKAVLVIFIDEAGDVAHVEVDRSNLPAEFEMSAREAFARARFRPGLIGERPVRSRLRIEVGFDSGVPDA
jgi:outer membrane biosynthesis protein TonB